MDNLGGFFMNEIENAEAMKEKIYMCVSSMPKKQISYHEVCARFPDCADIIASMVIDGLLVIRVTDDELLYQLSDNNELDIC
jgi:hypothetical protein